MENDILKKIDQELSALVSEINILESISPVNYKSQKKLFFESNFLESPHFEYKEHGVDLMAKKRALYNLPIEKLPDPDLYLLYEDVIESFVDKLDQYKSLGTPDFIYDSMRYFGEPSQKDVDNARFILHLPDMEENDPILDSKEIIQYFTDFAAKEEYPVEIELDDSMIANALVSGIKVKINPSVSLPQTEVCALAHHEIGVHLVTTLNARKQPLNVLSLGSPVNTTAQEGLAILCEHLSGNMTTNRLKILALRVMAVRSLVNDRDFKKTFELLTEDYNCNAELAFTITSRVYRGGGFSKDYLYLKGFRQILNAFETNPNFNYLLSGKVSLEQIDLVANLTQKGFFIEPHWISPAIKNQTNIDPVSQFIAHALK